MNTEAARSSVSCLNSGNTRRAVRACAAWQPLPETVVDRGRHLVEIRAQRRLAKRHLHDAALIAMLVAVHRHDRAREHAADVELPAAGAAEHAVAILEHELERVGPEQIDDAQATDARLPHRTIAALEALHRAEHVAKHAERVPEVRQAVVHRDRAIAAASR